MCKSDTQEKEEDLLRHAATNTYIFTCGRRLLKKEMLRCLPDVSLLLQQVDIMSGTFQQSFFFLSKQSPSPLQGFQCNRKAQVYSDHPLIHLGSTDLRVSSLTLYKMRRREQKEHSQGGCF